MASIETFSKELQHDGHIHRFLIASNGADGWEVREELDSHVVRRDVYRDWHRVERARTMMDLRVSLLRESGWAEP